MKRILFLITIIICSIVIGAGMFSYIVAEKLYFPKITEIANDGATGLNISAYQYESWFWNKDKITLINIHDRKNDAPNIQYKLKAEINSVRLIHSGEDFALIAYSNPNFSSMENAFVVHRSPKSESENTIEEIHIGGNIIAVAPDETAYFYISNSGKLFKRNWQKETVSSVDLEMQLEPILRSQLISIKNRESNQPVLFFSNNTKMAFWGIPVVEPWYSGYVFIWDLEKNEIVKISKQDIGDYNNLRVEEDKLYVERVDNVISQKLISE